MSLWLIALIAVYVIGVVAFVIAIVTEAPKHGAEVGVAHILVAIIWPFWTLWYLGILIKERVNG